MNTSRVGIIVMFFLLLLSKDIFSSDYFSGGFDVDLGSMFYEQPLIQPSYKNALIANDIDRLIAGVMLTPEVTNLKRRLEDMDDTPAGTKQQKAYDVVRKLDLDSFSSPIDDENDLAAVNAKRHAVYRDPNFRTRLELMNTAAEYTGDSSSFIALDTHHVLHPTVTPTPKKYKVSGGHSPENYGVYDFERPCVVAQDDETIGAFVYGDVVKTVRFGLDEDEIVRNARFSSLVASKGDLLIKQTPKGYFVGCYHDSLNFLDQRTQFPILVVYGDLYDTYGNIILCYLAEFDAHNQTVINMSPLTVSRSQFNSMVDNGAALLTQPGQPSFVDITKDVIAMFTSDLAKNQFPYIVDKKGIVKFQFPGKIYAFGRA